MATLTELTANLPLKTLAPGELLTFEGARSGRLFVLESGSLTVERGGVILTTIDQPGAVIGEMAALLDIPHSATVRAKDNANVRVVEEAIGSLMQSPELALHIATLACARLNATSALLVELRKDSKSNEHSALGRIFAALMSQPAHSASGSRSGWADHE